MISWMDRSVDRSVLVRLVSGSPRVIQKQIEGNKEETDFQIIFDYLPKISWYQAGIVFMTGYSNVAGGSLQLAQKGFQIDESRGFISQSVIKFENRIQIILQANPDSKRCISSTASNLTLVRFHWSTKRNGGTQTLFPRILKSLNTPISTVHQIPDRK